MTTKYIPGSVPGYSEGIVTSDTPPERVVTDTPSGVPNVNHWFTISGVHYNVHPYRSDLGGYPVRWRSEYGRD